MNFGMGSFEKKETFQAPQFVFFRKIKFELSLILLRINKESALRYARNISAMLFVLQRPPMHASFYLEIARF